ncbi:MAG: prenyltransferase/squalene oxidase repeat-containing protein [Planctomycetota bacterium]
MNRLAPLGSLLALALLSAPARANDADAVYGKALDFLLGKQLENGGWGQIPGEPPGEVGITALAVRALASAPAPFKAKARPAAEKGVGFILKHQQPNGSFTMVRSGLSTYRTALSVEALAAVDRTRYKAEIAKAAEWLKQDQFFEPQKVGPDSPHYGGFGYAEHGGTDPDADLSNTAMALAALHEAGIPPSDPVFKRAMTFLDRCQNSSETNKGVGKLKPKDDGGFIYDPGLSRNKSQSQQNADGTVSFESYASMTYNGFMSMLHAGVKKDDPRIKAALGWIKANYSLDENYGLGIRAKDPKAAQQGLYYYYHVFAKALSRLDSATVETKGGARSWAKDLVAALAQRQQKDGSFTNPNDRWWEGDPVLVTSYVLNALDYAYPYLPAERGK